MGRINDGFGWRTHPITKVRTFHDGVDYTVPTGVPISVNTPMTVVSAGVQNGYGNIVTARDEAGNTYKFAHLDQMNVKPGQQIQPGEVLGYTGNTGGSTGSHLHFEAANSAGKTIDPNSINPATGKNWSDVAGFESGKTLNESVKNAAPDKNRYNKPTSPANPVPAPSKDPIGDLIKQREQNKTKPRPRPTKGDVGILINPRHILGDGG